MPQSLEDTDTGRRGRETGKKYVKPRSSPQDSGMKTTLQRQEEGEARLNKAGEEFFARLKKTPRPATRKRRRSSRR